MKPPVDPMDARKPRLAPFHIAVVSGNLAAREAIGHFLHKLAPLGLEPEELSTVELILAEVLNNIVEHAYPEGDPDGPIEIRCRSTPRGLLVDILDTGRAMPDGPLPNGLPGISDVALHDMPEGGFGWFLIQHLAKDVRYRRIGGQNVMSMRLAIALGA